MSSTIQTRLDASHESCPECGASLATSGQETHCSECGLVVDDQHIDHGPEWRSYDERECKRTGAPRTVLRHDQGLSTTIGKATDDVSPSRRRRLSRQRRLHGRAKFDSKRDRNLAHAIGEVRRLTSALEQSQTVKQQASSLFRRAQDAELIQGRSIEGCAAAAVYVGCRQTGIVAMAEIAAVSSCSERHIWNCYRAIQTELELSVPLQLPVDWVPRICSELPLEIPSAVRRDARCLAEQATNSVHLNGSPKGIAAAAVYLASRDAGKRITQQTMGEALNLAPTTIRLWFQRLQTHILE